MSYLQRLLEAFLGLFSRKNLHSTKKKDHPDSASSKSESRYVRVDNESGDKHKQLQTTVRSSLRTSPSKASSEGSATVSALSKEQPETESVECKFPVTEQTDILEKSALPEEGCEAESADAGVLSSASEEETSVTEDTDPNTIAMPEACLNTPESIRPENPAIPEAENATVQKAKEVQATSFSALQEERSMVEKDPEADVTAVPQVPCEGLESTGLDQTASEEVTEVPVQEVTHESATLPPVLQEETPKSKEDLMVDVAVVPGISCNEPEENTCPDQSSSEEVAESSTQEEAHESAVASPALDKENLTAEENLKDEIVAAPETSCEEPKSAYPDQAASVEVTEVPTQGETHESADLFPILEEEIPTPEEETKDDIVTVSEVFSEEQKNTCPDQSPSIEVADVPAQGTAKESAETSSAFREDVLPAVEAEESNTAESESSNINPESACLDQPRAAEQEPLVQEETAHIDYHPPVEEKKSASSSNENENNIVSPVAANHEIAELSPPTQIHGSIEDELQTKNLCNQTILSSELVLCDIGNLHWSESGENTFTLWENDATGMSGDACATISIQRKETISFPGVQDGLDWEPLALHAARLVLAPFCAEQDPPPRIIEVVQDGLIVLTCELQKKANTSDVPFVTAAFTNRTAYLLTGAASIKITAEQYSKCISLKRNQPDC